MASLTAPLARLLVFVARTIFRDEEPIGDGFWLNRRENHVARIRNDDSPSATTRGRVNQLTAIAGICDDTLNRGGLWTNNGNNSACGDDIAKTDINELNVHGAHTAYGYEGRGII